MEMYGFLLLSSIVSLVTCTENESLGFRHLEVEGAETYIERWLRDSLASIKELEQHHQEEQEEKGLLLKRRWRAKLQLRRSGRQAEVEDRATLLQARPEVASVQALLGKAQRLQDQCNEIDLHTKRILAGQKANWSEGVLGGWRRQLSSFFRDDSVTECGSGSQALYPHHLTEEQDCVVLVVEPWGDIGSNTEFKTYRGEEDSVSPEMEGVGQGSRSFGLGYSTGEKEDAFVDRNEEHLIALNNTTNVDEGASPQALENNSPGGLFKWIVLHAATTLVYIIIRMRHGNRCSNFHREQL